jgi:hypothetical protein
VISSRIKAGVALLAAAFLSACHEESVTSAPAEPVSTQQAAEVFSRVCVAGFPSFADSGARAQKAGMVAVRLPAPAKESYQLPGRALFVALVDSPVGRVCSLSADSQEASAAVGKSVLSLARSIRGGEKEVAYPSSFFQYAYRLRSGAVITHDLRKKAGGANRNIFIITGPVRPDQVDILIYN